MNIKEIKKKIKDLQDVSELENLLKTALPDLTAWHECQNKKNDNFHEMALLIRKKFGIEGFASLYARLDELLDEEQ